MLIMVISAAFILTYVVICPMRIVSFWDAFLLQPIRFSSHVKLRPVSGLNIDLRVKITPADASELHHAMDKKRHAKLLKINWMSEQPT